MRRLVRGQPAQSRTFPAPVRGWIDDENLAANPGGGAAVMENWFPLQSTVRLRGGALKAATIGASPVLSLIPYRTASTAKLFAASATAVYDVSALNPTVAPAAAFSGQTSGRWSYIQFGTPGGVFLVMVNGTDNARYYDGTAWAQISASTTPGITGVATSALSHIWSHGSRIWAVEKNTLNAWYLPVDSIGGAMVQFALGSVFTNGGSLLFGAAWSGDSGDGMDDRCAFVTDQGEVAVYQGTNPSSLGEWSLVGRYDMGRPIGSQTLKIGGDVMIATADGIVPLSQVTVKDPAALAMAATTRAIGTSWQRAAKLRDVTKPYSMLRWNREGMAIIGLPHRSETFVANIQTGAWAKFTGWDVQCLALHNDLAYFGDSAGGVFQAEGAGADDGQPYVARLAFQDAQLANGAEVEAVEARATFRALAPFMARLSAATDYRRNFPPPPSAEADDSVPALWDVGLWDVSQWDNSPLSEERQTITTRWRGINRSGFSVSPQIQVACGSARKPDAEVVSFDLTFKLGAVVV